MNILNVYSRPDNVGGVERSMYVGARALKAAGHRITLLHGQTDVPATAPDYDAVLSVPDVFDRRAISPPPGLAAEEARVEEFLRQHQIDVLHVHGQPRSATLARWAERYAVVATVHVALCPNNARYHWKDREVCKRKIGLGCLTVGYATKGCGHLGNGEPNGLPGFVRGMADDFVLRRTFAKCARIIAPSHWIKGRLSQDGIPEQIIRVLEPPISEDGTAPEDVAEENPPVITYVGRLYDFKGVDHLLRASKLMSQRHSVWVIGDGPKRPELERLVVELGIQDRVTFFGALSPELLKQYRLRSSVITVPSLWPDNFPAVGPEAMLLNKPIAAYNVGGIPEWLKDGVTGYLVPPGDIPGLAAAFDKLLADPAKARALGRAGAALAREWTPDKHARRLVEIYREAVSAISDAGPRAVPEDQSKVTCR